MRGFRDRFGTADFLLALLQWALILTGLVGACADIIMNFGTLAGADSFRVAVDGDNAPVNTGSFDISLSLRLSHFARQLGEGLSLIALGAMLFCLRRIAVFLAALAAELRLVRGES